MCSLPPSRRVSVHVSTKAAYLFVCLFAVLLCYINVEVFVSAEKCNICFRPETE